VSVPAAHCNEDQKLAKVGFTVINMAFRCCHPGRYLHESARACGLDEFCASRGRLVRNATHAVCQPLDASDISAAAYYGDRLWEP
jgi:hypothetical protein